MQGGSSDRVSSIPDEYEGMHEALAAKGIIVALNKDIAEWYKRDESPTGSRMIIFSDQNLRFIPFASGIEPSLLLMELPMLDTQGEIVCMSW